MEKELKKGMKGTILIVDDEEETLQSIGRILSREGYTVFTASSGEMAIYILKENEIDILLTDLKMPGIEGIELMEVARTFLPDIETIVMSAYGTVEEAVDAMKRGAYDFIIKPLKKVDLKVVDKAMEKKELLIENRRLRDELLSMKEGERIIGNSPVMKKLMEVVVQVARSSANVFLEGESGSGKEVIAEVIHNMSERASHPLIKINCAAIPDGLLESELFGYEPGAFTGATMRKKGKFELAHRGTIFLDEIIELPIALQSKILRVLQDGEFERIGGTKGIKVDVRVITATNKNPEQEVERGRFRQDLYYRLNVIRIKVPPLRERKEDIPLLIGHFIRLFNKKNRREIKGVDDEALKVLLNYDWPGNVRELQNVIERGVVLAMSDTIRINDLPPEIVPSSLKTPVRLRDDEYFFFPIGTPLDEIERGVILKTLKYTGGDKERMAKLLGISIRTIYRRLEELGETNKKDKTEEQA